MQVKNSTFYITVSLLGLCMFALALRLMPLTNWIQHKQTYLQQGSVSAKKSSLIDSRPVIENVDGYYYLAATQQYLDGSYSSIDNHRAVPDTVIRKPYPPMLSFLMAVIVKVSGFSLDWIGVILPSVLSLLVTIPLFFLGRACLNNFASILVCAIYLFTPLTLYRASFGFLDTDCLNPFFPLMAIVCAVYFVRTDSKKKYFFFLVGIINWLLYMWWWDQSFAPPTVLGLAPFFLALLFCYRPPKKEGILFFTSIGVIVFILFSFLGFEILPELCESVFSLLKYVSKQKESIYPSLGIHITEQTPMPLSFLVKHTLIHPALLVVSVFGIFGFGWKIRWECILFLPLTIVGAFTIFFANRFVIFLLPVLCLGFVFTLVYFGNFLKKYLSKKWRISGEVVAVAIVLALCWRGFCFFSKTFSSPVIKAGEANAMRAIQKNTPKDALIWSWWESGHPLVYYAQRDTVNDGMMHSLERNYLTAFPLTAKNDREAANFMNFYAEAGIDGYKEFVAETKKAGFDGRKILRTILADGKEAIPKQFANLPQKTQKKWQALLFPTQQRTIYLYIPLRRSSNFLLTHYIGTWDFHKKEGEKSLITVILGDAREPKMPRKISEGKDINIPNIKWDAVTRTLKAPDIFLRPLQVESVWLTQEKCRKIASGVVRDKKNRYGEWLKVPIELAPVLADNGIYDLDINAPKNMLVFQDTRITEDLLPRLFWRKKYNPKYFTPIDLRPDYQLWKVTSDMWKRNNMNN